MSCTVSSEPVLNQHKAGEDKRLSRLRDTLCDDWDAAVFWFFITFSLAWLDYSEIKILRTQICEYFMCIRKCGIPSCLHQCRQKVCNAASRFQLQRMPFWVATDAVLQCKTRHIGKQNGTYWKPFWTVSDAKVEIFETLTMIFDNSDYSFLSRLRVSVACFFV